MSEQIRLISSGVDIITCTPGRLEDFIQSNKISLSNVRFFILDEAVSTSNFRAYIGFIVAEFVFPSH